MDESRIELILRQRRPDEPVYQPAPLDRAMVGPSVERVSRATGAVPQAGWQPARRFGAVAGVVAVVAVLAVLAVGMPSGNIGPAATDSPQASVAAEPQLILSTNEFVAALTEGPLDGQAVLVDAGIDPTAESLERGCVSVAGGCYLGVLTGTEPAVPIWSKRVAVPEGEGPRPADGSWPWWDMPSLPVGGTLVLSVGSERSIEYLGRLRPGESSPMAEAGWPRLLNELDTHDVLAVDGELTGTELVPTCPYVETISGLPSRHCRDHMSHLDGVRVQNGAYQAHAPDPQFTDAGAALPRRAIYVVAPRLQGGGCPEEPPCLDWEVIGRLTVTAEPSHDATPLPTSEPTPVPTADISPAPPVAPSAPPAGPATWRIDPDSQISAASTLIRVLLTEQACASGMSPEGRVLEPVIEYRADAIVITLSVRPLPGDCPTNPEYPMTVELTEPIGDRRLLDGGKEPPVERWAPYGVLYIPSEEPYEAALARLRELAGPGACLKEADVLSVPDMDRIEREASVLPGGVGMLAEGDGYVGAPHAAAEAFGALEAYYRDREWVIVVAFADQSWLSKGIPLTFGPWVAAEMDHIELADGRSVWMPARDTLAVDEGCNAVDVTVSSGDFELTIRSARSVYDSSDAIEATAELVYRGEQSTVTLAGSGSGLIQLLLTQLDGHLEINLGFGQTDDCARYALEPDVPLIVPIESSGDYRNASPGPRILPGGSPDRGLRLPPGTWRITGYANFSVNTCDVGATDVVIETSVVIRTE